MTISGGRTKQLDIFCCVPGFVSDFLSFMLWNLFGSFMEPFNWSLKCNIRILESPGKVLEFQKLVGTLYTPLLFNVVIYA